MTYTKEDAKRLLDLATDSLKQNTKCAETAEELDKRNAEYSSEEKLNLIAKILTVADEERKKK